MTIPSASSASNSDLRSQALSAWEDLAGGLSRSELWGRIGWLEIKHRYRRTTLGPFWNSATLAVYTIAVGIVGAALWQLPIQNYLPYFSSGIVVWTLLSTIVIEACTLFVAGHAFFRNVRFEYSILAYGLVWRNSILFLHNLVVFLLIVLVLNPTLLSPVMLLAIPGLVLVLVNGVWITLLTGMICLRYRDVQSLIQVAIQILLFITPIFWTREILQGTHQLIFVQLNPVFHLMEVVRSPLLGQIPATASYGAVLLTAVAGWGMTYLAFRRFRKRIAYWS